ncbi:uncharacterized protein [Henckelia pumila]|uniref:uncharacterized protein isoform X2 n=1 Tax=Henckelia pumila TaxID=405737 RepID=UPI003C6E2039
MVSGSKIEGGAQVLSAGVRKTIQSIKEIVGNHSDADIYVALKETDMDPNETAQKLLNQDPFHEVKRKRDRKKESSGYKTFVAVETKNNEVARIPMKYNTYSDRNAQRGGYGRNLIYGDAGAAREFRVVRDNRVNQNASLDSKLVQSSTSRGEGVISNGPVKSSYRNSTGPSGHQSLPVGQHSSQALNGPADSLAKKTKDTIAGDNDSKELVVVKRLPTPSSDLRVQTKANDSIPYSASSNNSIVGVYSSSSDPVHVPSLHSKPAINVGAIRREVGVVGPRRHSSEISVKSSTFQSTSNSNPQLGRESHSRESARPSGGLSKSDQSGQSMAPESSTPGPSMSRSFSSNQFGNRSHHQVTGHQKVTQPNKEWKPKSTIKPIASTPVVIETSAKTVSPASGLEELKEEVTEMQDNISRLTISENQNVIIAAHIRVSEADRYRLTFGSLGTELDISRNLVFKSNDAAEELSREPSGSVSVSNLEASGDEPGGSKQLEMRDDSVQSSGFNSPASDDVSDSQLTEKKEASSPQNLENYADIGLVGDNPPSYTPELLHQDTSELSNFSGYDPHMGYDMPYFRPLADETVRGPVLPSSQEVLSSHLTNTVPASTIAMVQQPQHQQQLQQQMAQMYPQLHVSHYANLMPYRQFLSPVYVPPMPLPGYSNSPAYPHPSNGSSYLLMPGNGAHISPSGLKYGVQQFKPVPTGGPTGYGNFTSPTGYAINTPGVGNVAGHEDSSRLKYNDSLYAPNPQAETSEIWMNPRELPSLQSASYYNIPGQTPHAAYLPSHAAAAAQSSHMQFSGMYHPSQQPTAIANPHHLGPAMGGNVGVGVAAPGPGAQVGAYHQPQLGHLNWAVNF